MGSGPSYLCPSQGALEDPELEERLESESGIPGASSKCDSSHVERKIGTLRVSIFFGPSNLVAGCSQGSLRGRGSPLEGPGCGGVMTLRAYV